MPWPSLPDPVGGSLTQSAEELVLPPAIQAGLFGDERVLWVGRPGPSPLLEPFDALIVPWGLMWAAFTCLIVWFVGPDPGFFVPVSIPFVLIGLYLSFGRILLRRSRRGRTTYAVTTRRAFIAISARREVIREFDLRRSPSLESRARADGWGTLAFGVPMTPVYQRVWGGAALHTDFTFDNIANVNEVKAMASSAHFDQR